LELLPRRPLVLGERVQGDAVHPYRSTVALFCQYTHVVMSRLFFVQNCTVYLLAQQMKPFDSSPFHIVLVSERGGAGLPKILPSVTWLTRAKIVWELQPVLSVLQCVLYSNLILLILADFFLTYHVVASFTAEPTHVIRTDPGPSNIPWPYIPKSSNPSTASFPHLCTGCRCPIQ
jgi:hypothetical protein